MRFFNSFSFSFEFSIRKLIFFILFFLHRFEKAIFTRNSTNRRARKFARAMDHRYRVEEFPNRRDLV